MDYIEGAAMEMRQTVTLRDVQVEYVDTGGDGPVVVLLHGVLMNESLWQEVVARLTPQYRCVIPVLPMGAHRLSASPDVEVSPGLIVEMIADLLDDLKLTDVTLVGNDTGGALAQMLVTKRPERVGRLVLASCDAFENFPPGLPGKTMALLCKIPGAMYMAMLSLRIPLLRRLPFTFGRMAKRSIPEDIFNEWLNAYLSDRGVRKDVLTLMSRIDRQDLFAAADGLFAFEGPTLIVWAREDRVMPVEHATKLAERISDARVVFVEDSYTLMPLDQPEALADLVAEHARVGASRHRNHRA